MSFPSDGGILRQNNCGIVDVSIPTFATPVPAPFMKSSRVMNGLSSALVALFLHRQDTRLYYSHHPAYFCHGTFLEEVELLVRVRVVSGRHKTTDTAEEKGWMHTCRVNFAMYGVYILVAG